MANINDWLSIDKASGTGNAYITLTASSSTELQERIASLSIKTRSKEVFLNVKQLAFNNYFVLGKNLRKIKSKGVGRSLHRYCNSPFG